MRLFKTVVTWALQIFLGALLLMVGSGKFLEPSWARRFEDWGYPAGFVFVVGAVEVLCALGLFVPRLTSYSAALLMIVMIGAALTHAVHGEMRQFTSPVAFFVLLGLLALLRRSSAAPWRGFGALPREEKRVV